MSVLRSNRISSNTDEKANKTQTGTQNNKQHGHQGIFEMVNEVISSPGLALEDSEKTYFEPLFGHDFSKVRVHTGDKAAQSALHLGASAFTVGRHVVFGNEQYEPSTHTGRSLLAHELTHVVQQDFKRPLLPLQLGAKDDRNELVAENMSLQIANQNPSSKSPYPISQSVVAPGSTIQRSLLGGIFGGIGGALGGAMMGAALGGPLGAVVGGIAGFIAGAVMGDDATTESRALKQDEIDYAKDIFRDTIDYSKIKVTRDSMMAVGAPRTIGNTINLKSSWDHFKGDTLELTESGKETLIHEMGHVWQYQNGGLAYIPESLWSQLKAKLSGKDRGAAYNWQGAHTEGIPWEKWNPEQQASAIEEYNKLLRKSKVGAADVKEIATLAILTKYMENVWQKKGAPSFVPTSFAGTTT